MQLALSQAALGAAAAQLQRVAECLIALAEVAASAAGLSPSQLAVRRAALGVAVAAAAAAVAMALLGKRSSRVVAFLRL